VKYDKIEKHDFKRLTQRLCAYNISFMTSGSFYVLYFSDNTNIRITNLIENNRAITHYNLHGLLFDSSIKPLNDDV